MAILEGKALVASPYLMDPNFMRSVVYIHRHNDDGALGFILNRPMEITVGELLEQLLELKVPGQSKVYTGGPVEGPLMLLYEQAVAQAAFEFGIEEEPDEKANHLGIQLTTDQAKIIQTCKHDQGRYRVFDGYAGWSPGQLEQEMQEGGWLVWELSLDDVFSSVEELWEQAIRTIGRDILKSSIKAARIPDDPAYN